MATETIPIQCPACGKATKGLPLSVVASVDGRYQKIYCCNCKHLIHVKVA